ncbi:MAG: YhdP family protein [Candidatus Contendobacter sp.]|nr:YhdP family protein [Candidatus Contendobacter sp.]
MNRRWLGAARRTFRWTRWLVLALLLPALLVAGFGQWWLLPRLNEHRAALAAALGEYLRVPARIEEVAAEREGEWLSLRLRNVSLRDPVTDAALVQFDRAAVTVDLWRSLREWRPVFGYIRLEGVNLTLEQVADGIPRLRADSGPAESAFSLAEVARWLFDVGRLDILGDRLTVRGRDGGALDLRHPYFQVRDTGTGQRLVFTTELPATLGDRFYLEVERPRADPESWRGAFTLHPDRPHPFAWSWRGDQWQGRIQGLRVQEVAAWAAPWLEAPVRRWLAALDPRGDAPDIQARAEPATGAYAVTAQLREVAFQPVDGLPGFERLSGTLELTPGRGQIALDSRKARLDTAGLLRAPVTLDTLAGTVIWARVAEGLRLESAGLDFTNADLNARVWGAVIVPDQGTPLLDLHGRYRDVKVGTARRYLPVTVIPPDGVAWLDRALVGGRITAGEGVLRGPATDFPFDRGEGLFETRFQVEGAVLDYAPGWPRLEAVRGTVRFRNRDLWVEIDAGRVLDADVAGATARIDDLENPVVWAKGRARGPGASLWQAFRDSPVGQDLGEDLPELRIGGASALELELVIPTDVRPSRARGRVELLDNRVALPDGKLELERTRGVLRFTESSLEARGLQAWLRDEPIRLDLDLVGRPGRRDLRARLQGRLGLRALIGEPLAGTLERTVGGKSTWNAVLTVPTHRRERRDDAPPFRLDMNSDLRGVVVRLPAPLGKTADESRPLKISLRPRARDALELLLSYGEGTRAALELVDPAGAPRLTRGEVRVNAGAAKLPEPPGLAVVAELPRWELAAFPAAPEEAASPRSELRSLEARIGELVLGRRAVAGVTVSATRRDDELRLDFDGKTLAGRVIVPDQPSPERPVTATLQRLHLRRAAESTPSAAPDAANARVPDPRRMPPLTLTATDLRWDGAELGQLRLVAMPRPNGVRLAEFKLESERQRIDATGDWAWAGRGQTSRMRGTLHSRALGDTLRTFGYAWGGIAGGETEAELAVEWPGALSELAPERLEGTLKLTVGPGQLLEVDPGMGRMVGLFNVQNLLRRLTLDFRDLVQPGMSFDRITGQFAFQRGQARTDDLTIEAPAARIRIEGRTDLKARDYDQRITVIPRIGGALPVAGALAGGPAVGAAVLLAERLLQKGIEQATQYHYALTGSWDRPVMKLLEEPQTANPVKGLVGDQ